MTPKRIQLRRTRGWRKPAGAVVVSRPSRWGNPFRVRRYCYGGWDVVDGGDNLVAHQKSKTEAARIACEAFEKSLRGGLCNVTIADVRRELAGKDLCCWCPEDAEHCHADVLLRWANEPKGTT